MNLKLTLLVVAVALVTLKSHAKENCDKALDAVPKYESKQNMFKQISEFRAKYSHCMDGGIASGISAVIVESLDKNWKQVSAIKSISKKDPTFYKFIFANIQPDVTGQEAEVKSIITKAKTSCPRGMKPFCNDLIEASNRSMESQD